MWLYKNPQAFSSQSWRIRFSNAFLCWIHFCCLSSSISCVFAPSGQNPRWPPFYWIADIFAFGNDKNILDKESYAIANFNWLLGPRNTNDLISMVSCTFTMRRHFIRLASAPYTSSRLAKFGWARFSVCNAWQQSRMENLRRLGENCGPILTHLWTKVHKISDDDCMRPLEALYFPARCPIVCVTFCSADICH